MVIIDLNAKQIIRILVMLKIFIVSVADIGQLLSILET
jgi:hypothetical protein